MVHMFKVMKWDCCMLCLAWNNYELVGWLGIGMKL